MGKSPDTSAPKEECRVYDRETGKLQEYKPADCETSPPSRGRKVSQSQIS